jgi:hypothetical protein
MTTMNLAELKAFTIAELARKKADQDAAEKKKQIEEFDTNVAELKAQLEKHLPVQLVKEYGIDYRQSTSSNALVMAVIDYRGAEICIWQAPASNWTHWDVKGGNVEAKSGVASEELAQVILVDFIDAIDKAVKTYDVELKVLFEVSGISSEAAIQKAKELIKSIADPLVVLSANTSVPTKISELL